MNSEENYALQVVAQTKFKNSVPSGGIVNRTRARLPDTLPGGGKTG